MVAILQSAPTRYRAPAMMAHVIKRRQAVQLETFRLGGVVGRHDFVRSTNVAFLIGNLACRVG